MNKDVLLSDFNILDMETYLDKQLMMTEFHLKLCENAVKDIKHFIRQSKSCWSPCRDMETLRHMI